MVRAGCKLSRTGNIQRGAAERHIEMTRFFAIILYLACQTLAAPVNAGEISQPVEPATVEEGSQQSDGSAAGSQSPQRAKTGTGIAAGSAAGQTRRGGNGFFNTTLLVGIVVVGATAAIALEAASDNDTIPSTTSTTGTN